MATRSEGCAAAFWEIHRGHYLSRSITPGTTFQYRLGRLMQFSNPAFSFSSCFRPRTYSKKGTVGSPLTPGAMAILIRAFGLCRMMLWGGRSVMWVTSENGIGHFGCYGGYGCADVLVHREWQPRE